MSGTDAVPFREAMKVWARVAALSFGGPAGQIAVMHRIIVEEKRWIGDQRFLQALNYCTLLPGPEAQQLATYIGWLMHRTKGGVVAGGLFVLPGLVAIMALSWIYVLLGRVPAVQGLFFGLKAAVLVIEVEAVLRVGKRALANNVMRSLAHARPTLGWGLGIGGVLLALWLLPVAALALWCGIDATATQVALFFSKMAVVTFGGAYAVLAYVAQQAVDTFHWVRPQEMLDGLGMAESTPGPLIMVTQFVGFLALWRDPGSLPPLVAATLGGLLTTWVTFVPCFLWIFVGAPFAEVLRGSKALAAALAAITAAVVGVILNLAVWFGLHVLFGTLLPIHIAGATLQVPVLSTVDLPSLAIATAAAIAIFRFKVGMIPVLLASAGLGIVYTLAA